MEGVNESKYLAIDVGGSALKGGIVDLGLGKLVTERFKVKVNTPATVEEMTDAFRQIVDRFDAQGQVVGVGFPSVVKSGGVAMTATNIDKRWIGRSVADTFGSAGKVKVHVVNDADAAGLAELDYGAGKACRGTVLLLTLGTGIGSAIFSQRVLLPNTELGSAIHLHGKPAERYASARAKDDNKLSFKKWSARLQEYFDVIEPIFHPDMIILGGGGSKSFAKLDKHLNTTAELRQASLLNHAGIVGAAMHAHRMEIAALLDLNQ